MRRLHAPAIVLALCILAAGPSSAAVPDMTQSFFVPQVGTVASPTEGTLATRLFRMCPNNDGGTSLPNNARIKVVLRDINGNPVPGVLANDICLLFNGGTQAQGYTGIGADSILANSQWLDNLGCPDVRCVAADAPTDANGVTYITFAGADASNPGVASRNAQHKWGHYDSDIPVYALGFKLQGRLTSASANGTYVLRIKNLDFHRSGLGPERCGGERVSDLELNMVANMMGVNNAVSYWLDFDTSGGINSTDLNVILAHVAHNCTYPNNP